MSKRKKCGTAVSQEVKRRSSSGATPYEARVMLDLLVKSMRDASVFLEIPLDRDIKTVEERFKAEGFGFISKTLPMFQDWLRSCLEAEHLSPCTVFKNHYTMQDGRKVFSPYPSFLRGLVMKIANEDGTITYGSTPAEQDLRRNVLKCINMFCTSFGKKYEVPLSSDKRDSQVLDWFRSDEECFSILNAPLLVEGSLTAKALANARYLIESIFTPYTASGVQSITSEYGTYEKGVDFATLKPSHGSGATSFGLVNHEKFTQLIGFPIRYTQLDTLSNIYSLPGETCEKVLSTSDEGLSKERLDSWLQGGISKVAVVPKNSKKGRIICMEPAENMLAQQGLRKAVYDLVESHPLSRGFINFRDQDINGLLALQASKNGYHATLDLKAASDSVGGDLVRLLFPDEIYRWFDSCRSRFARATINTYKGGKKVGKRELKRKLVKFAPMGSALCFPVEAMCFWAIAKGTLMALGRKDTDVWTYGDDLVLPSVDANDVATVYKNVGFEINSEKSYTKGHFRESCGVDAFDGLDISPSIRCSTRLPGIGINTNKKGSNSKSTSTIAASVAAWVEYANAFEQDGFPSVSRHIRRVMAELWPSSKSFPRLTAPYVGGMLHYLSYSDGRQVNELGRLEREVGKRLVEYNFVPTFPNPPSSPWRNATYDGENSSPVQGELFTLVKPLNYYCGRTYKGWMLVNEPQAVLMNESERRLRYWCEGGSDSQSDMFASKENLRLVRKRIVLS